jgi:large subunit ribosomal protein L29
MKPSELRDKDDDELVDLEKDLREQLVRLRIGLATNKRVNTAKFKEIRRDIARIKTIQTERQNAPTTEAAGAPS